MLLVSLVLVTLVVAWVAYRLGRRDEGQVHRDWRFLLSPRSEEVYRSVEGRMGSELALATLSYEHAFAVRDMGAQEEAKRLLALAHDVIEKFCPGMLKLLAAMATFSRMAAAIAPVAPLRPRAFRIGHLAALAYLHRFLSRLVVTGPERFRLHLYVLGRSFGIAARFLLQATKRITGGAPGADADWRNVRAAIADIQTLTDKSLQNLRALLQGLDRQHAEEALAKLDEPSGRRLDREDLVMIAAWAAFVAACYAVLTSVR